MAKYKNPMLPPRKPEDLVQAKHDKIHEDYTPPGLPQDIFAIIKDFDESDEQFLGSIEERLSSIDYTPPGLPQDILDIIEETKERAIKEGRWK